MIWVLRIMAFLFGLAATFIVLYAVATSYGWEKIWQRLAGPADMGNVSFSGFTKEPGPNQALVCPPGLCDRASIDFSSPTYALSADKLRKTLLESLELEQRLERVDDDQDPLRLRFIQRTKRLKFPDTISVEIIPVKDGMSALAVYSRSQIGKSDLGVNRSRLERWFARLQAFEAS